MSVVHLVRLCSEPSAFHLTEIKLDKGKKGLTVLELNVVCCEEHCGSYFASNASFSLRRRKKSPDTSRWDPELQLPHEARRRSHVSHWC